MTAQSGQMGLLVILEPIYLPHIHIEDPLLFGRQRLVKSQHPHRLVAAIQGRIRAKQIGEILHPPEPRFDRRKPPLLTRGRPTLGQKVIDSLF